MSTQRTRYLAPDETLFNKLEVYNTREIKELLRYLIGPSPKTRHDLNDLLNRAITIEINLASQGYSAIPELTDFITRNCELNETSRIQVVVETPPIADTALAHIGTKDPKKPLIETESLIDINELSVDFNLQDSIAHSTMNPNIVDPIGYNPASPAGVAIPPEANVAHNANLGNQVNPNSGGNNANQEAHNNDAGD